MPSSNNAESSQDVTDMNACIMLLSRQLQRQQDAIAELEEKRKSTMEDLNELRLYVGELSSKIKRKRKRATTVAGNDVAGTDRINERGGHDRAVLIQQRTDYYAALSHEERSAYRQRVTVYNQGNQQDFRNVYNVSEAELLAMNLAAEAADEPYAEETTAEAAENLTRQHPRERYALAAHRHREQCTNHDCCAYHGA